MKLALLLLAVIAILGGVIVKSVDAQELSPSPEYVPLVMTLEDGTKIQLEPAVSYGEIAVITSLSILGMVVCLTKTMGGVHAWLR